MIGIQPTRDELAEAFAGVKPGEYLTRDLLPHYLAWAARNGRSRVDAKSLGEMIARTTCLESRLRGGVKVWTLDPQALICRNWFTPSKGSTAEMSPEPVTS